MNKIITTDRKLDKCKEYAKHGDELARNSVAVLKENISKTLLNLDYTIEKLKNKNVNRKNILESIIKQLSNTKQKLDILPEKLLDEIQLISDDKFNITLFGRTMAGKSTLMEILTHGNGESIGKGMQRTTRDVRNYTYNGITITDVPGIAAFEGEDDEKIAFDAAKKCDLILFLITDDAPQASEAECLNNILSLGKPVICVVNIKANIDSKTNLRLFARDIEKKMKPERLEEIKKQFLMFGEQYGQSWNKIYFEFVHLKAAYLSQQKEFSNSSKELYVLSKFDNLKKIITNEVSKKGGFYKVKAYVDIVAVPIKNAAEIFLEDSMKNNIQCTILKEKKEKLAKWKDNFERDGKKEINSVLEQIKAEIKKEVPLFAENHYNDKNASKKWTEEIEKYNIEKRCSELIEELAKRCEQELRDIYSEISIELNFSQKIFEESKFNIPQFVNEKKIWNWCVTILSAGLGIAAFFSVPFTGWAALGVGVLGPILSNLFKSKEEKVKEARTNLEKKILESLNIQMEKAKRKLEDYFSKKVIQENIPKAITLIDEITEAIVALSDVQYSLSDKLFKQYEKINYNMLSEAVDYLKISYNMDNIRRIARIPGGYLMMVINDRYGIISKILLQVISNLVNERILVISNESTPEIFISQIIGCDRTNIEINNIYRDSQVVKIKNIEALSKENLNRMQLVQQLCGLLIMK